ncbi:MAG: J domain-containing protein [Chloroflexi bacterium]|nr:J domain-containing protein [Chloroflexota bacterium]
MNKRFQDLYKTLQVDPDAEPEVIAAAYRRLAAKYHPDVNASPEAAERMLALNLAYEVLGDPVRRAAYHSTWRLRAQRDQDAPRPHGQPRRQAGHYPSARPTTGPEPPPPPVPTLVLTPAVLDFGRIRRGHRPALTLQIGVTDGGTVQARVRGSQPWVLCSSSEVQGPHGKVEVSIDTTQLDQRGQHRAELLVDTAAHGNHAIPVFLYLLAAPKPYIMLTPTALDFGAVRLGSEPPSLPLRVLNGGRGTLEGVAAARVPWLTVEPATFRGNQVDLRVTARVDHLPSGCDYVGQVDVSSNGGEATAQAMAFVLRAPRPGTPWRDDTPADRLFLDHRARLLSSVAYPTARQAIELELVQHLQACCPGDQVNRTLQRAIAHLKGLPIDEVAELALPANIPLDVLDDVFQRLRRWGAYRG